MASDQVSAKLHPLTYVPATDFTYELGQWSMPTGSDPAELVQGTLIQATAEVVYDTKLDHNVRIIFDLLKPEINFGWGVNISGLGIIAKVGENGNPTGISLINDDYVGMPTEKRMPIGRVFNLKANPAATERKLYFQLVDNTAGTKGGLSLGSATVEVLD